MEDGTEYEFLSENKYPSQFSFSERKPVNRYVFKVYYNFDSADSDSEKRLFKLYENNIKDKGLKNVKFYILEDEKILEPEEAPVEIEVSEEKDYTLVYDSTNFNMDVFLTRYSEGFNKNLEYFTESLDVEFVKKGE